MAVKTALRYLICPYYTQTHHTLSSSLPIDSFWINLHGQLPIIYFILSEKFKLPTISLEQPEK